MAALELDASLQRLFATINVVAIIVVAPSGSEGNQHSDGIKPLKSNVSRESCAGYDTCRRTLSSLSPSS